MKNCEIPGEDLIFQQNNDPKHTSNKARHWMEDNDIILLDWPPQSPDLNPIEHLWQHIKTELCKVSNTCQRSLGDLGEGCRSMGEDKARGVSEFDRKHA
jgi:transposase